MSEQNTVAARRIFDAFDEVKAANSIDHDPQKQLGVIPAAQSASS